MTSIERTAYPRFSKRQQFHKQWLKNNFGVTEDEAKFIRKHAYKPALRLCFAIQYKVFKYLGYFTHPDDVPGVVIKTIRHSLGVEHKTEPKYNNDTTMYRHRNTIRLDLGIIKWNSTEINPRRIAIEAAYKAAQTMNNPADIINVTVESLVKLSCELPAFSTLDRLVRHVRNQVNSKIFRQTLARLQNSGIDNHFEKLLILPEGYNRTGFNSLKQLPKNPTVTNFKLLLKHHNWLMDIGDMEDMFDGIAKIKLAQFAEQARSLDASEIRSMEPHAKYTLMASLLYQSQHEIKDALSSTLCKVVFKTHKDAIRTLKELREKHSKNAHDMALFLIELTSNVEELKDSPELLTEKIIDQYTKQGGTEGVLDECEKVAAYNSKNHYPLLWRFFKTHRATLFELVQSLTLSSSTQNRSLIEATEILIANANKKARQIKLDKDLDLSFAAGDWNKLVFVSSDSKQIVDRRYFELCVFSNIANDLRSGDLFVEGADSYSDYRKNLLPWGECLPLLDQFCEEVGLPSNNTSFVAALKQKFIKKAAMVDKLYPKQSELIIDENGVPTLKRTKSAYSSSSSLLYEIKSRMPERNLIDIMCNSHQYTGWADVFGPLSGSEPKISNAIERYIINTFGNGTAMGPLQTARHMKSNITQHMLTRINNKHVNLANLDKAIERLINFSNGFAVTKILGDSRRCAVDGTLHSIYESNLLAEAHFRYKNKGGIAYHHISDNYIALFSTFIPCGVWEAVEIIEGLIRNKSDIQPDTVHADTQGQSTPVFGLSHLFAIKLMPRIRNWKDLTFFRPDRFNKYKHIDSLFGKEINWQLIETHWQDLMQVALSIKHGKISSSVLLRKLSNYSRKNRLYQAFQELGRVIRTIFLLEYISDPKLRAEITASTNKVEAYNGLSDWVFFGSNRIVASNDAEEMEKAIKYNMIITNSIILQNFVDISQIIYQLRQEGWVITKGDIARLSPYLTEHIKRFGYYVVNLKPAAAIPDEIRDLAILEGPNV